jgi:hypothetical protein
VAESEGVPCSDDGLEAIIFTAEGDMRNALNNLQVKRLYMCANMLHVFVWHVRLCLFRIVGCGANALVFDCIFLHGTVVAIKFGVFHLLPSSFESPPGHFCGVYPCQQR